MPQDESAGRSVVNSPPPALPRRKPQWLPTGGGTAARQNPHYSGSSSSTGMSQALPVFQHECGLKHEATNLVAYATDPYPVGMSSSPPLRAAVSIRFVGLTLKSRNTLARASRWRGKTEWSAITSVTAM